MDHLETKLDVVHETDGPVHKNRGFDGEPDAGFVALFGFQIGEAVSPKRESAVSSERDGEAMETMQGGENAGFACPDSEVKAGVPLACLNLAEHFRRILVKDAKPPEEGLSPVFSGQTEDLFTHKAGSAAGASNTLPQAEPLNERMIRIEELVERFDQRLLNMVQRGGKMMRITMQPSALGRLMVCIRKENSSVMVEIHSQSNAVRELMVQQENAVRRLMQEHGIELGGFDVFSSDGGDGQRSMWMEEAVKDSCGIGPASDMGGDAREMHYVYRKNEVFWIA